MIDKKDHDDVSIEFQGDIVLNGFCWAIAAIIAAGLAFAWWIA